MAALDIKIPQMGEGLTEVRLLQFLKSPGDVVAKDELIYTMETEKATLEVESPEEGTLLEWLAAEGDVLPIGASVARIQPSGDTASEAVRPADNRRPDAAPLRPQSSERIIPPRTRAYARELGITEETLALIPSVTARLMPVDIDNYRAGLSAAVPAPALEAAQPDEQFVDRPLPERQRTLNFHMKRSAQIVIPGTIMRPLSWECIRNHVARQRKDSSIRPTEFQAFAYCVARAGRHNPKFLSSLVRDDTVRQFEHLNLGVAVALPDGELTVAVVPRADTLPYAEFMTQLQERVQSARAGEDQADAKVQMHLSYLGAHGVRDAVPVLVSPAVAVLFIGEAYAVDGKLVANVALTFDHRLINGVEAAEMLNATAMEIERLASAAPQ